MKLHTRQGLVSEVINLHHSVALLLVVIGAKENRVMKDAYALL